MATIKGLVKTDFLRVDKNDTVGKLIAAMNSQNKRNALVFDGKTFIGTIRKLDLLITHEPIAEMKVANVVKATTLLDENADVVEAAYIMFNVSANMLPVQRDGKIVGVVQVIDIIGLISDYDELKNMAAEDIGYNKTTGVDEDERIGVVLHMMHDLHTYNIPLLSGGKLAGMISISDILSKYSSQISGAREHGSKQTKDIKAKGHDSERSGIEDLPVRNFATMEIPESIDYNSKLQNAAQIMNKRNIMSLAVMKNGAISGILTANDVLRAMASLYIGPKFNIKFTGLNKVKLAPDKLEYMQHVISHEAEKLRHYFDGDFDLEVRIKVYAKGGNREKYAVSIKMDGPGRMIESEEADWDIVKVVHMNFEHLKNQLKHAYRSDSQHYKKYER